MSTAVAKKSKTQKVKVMLNNKLVLRTIRNIEDEGDNFTAEMTLKGETVLVTRRKRARSWNLLSSAY